MRKFRNISILLVLVIAVVVRLYMNKQQLSANTRQVSEELVIPVYVAEVQEAPAELNFNFRGSFSPVREVMVISETQGKINRLNIQNGKQVRKGDLLLSTVGEVANSQHRLAKAAYDKALADLKKFEELQKGNAVTVQQMEEMKLAVESARANLVMMEKQSTDVNIYAPISGIIHSRQVEEGSLLMPGAPVAGIADLSELKLIVSVTDRQVSFIQPGMKADVSCSAFPGRIFPGRLVSVAGKADLSGRFPVEVLVENPKSLIKAGMTGEVIFRISGKKESLMIPREAIVGSLKDPSVFTIEGERAYGKKILTGESMGNEVEVIRGLEKGNIVVVSGQINLEDSTLVVVSNK